MFSDYQFLLTVGVNKNRYITHNILGKTFTLTLGFIGKYTLDMQQNIMS